MSERRESYTTMDEAELEQRFVAEMERIVSSNPSPAMLQLQPHDAFVVIGLLQLACRHPSVDGYPRAVATTLVGALAGMFDDASAIGESIRRGWEQQ